LIDKSIILAHAFHLFKKRSKKLIPFPKFSFWRVKPEPGRGRGGGVAIFLKNLGFFKEFFFVSHFWGKRFGGIFGGRLG